LIPMKLSSVVSDSDQSRFQFGESLTTAGEKAQGCSRRPVPDSTFVGSLELKEPPMRVMAIYVIIVVFVESIAVLIGLQLDKTMPVLGVPLALVLFFGALGGGWYL